jgi:hypothetical protein
MPLPRKTITALVALVAFTSTQAVAETASLGSSPRGPFVEAYVYACQPVEYDFAGARYELSVVGRWIHDNLFLTEQRGNCRDFYLAEVAPRLE